jgi:hypothetical protein
MTERTMPEGLSDERSLLDGWLDYYRATLLAKCDGLTGQQLITRSCEPSPMSLVGLVRHMTEMERVYGHRLADWGISWLYCTDENGAGDFEAVTAAGTGADLNTFRAHCARTTQIMAAHPARPGPRLLQGQTPTSCSLRPPVARYVPRPQSIQLAGFEGSGMSE